MRTYCPYCGRPVKFFDGGYVVRCWTCRHKYYLPPGEYISLRRVMASARRTATVVGVVALVAVLWVVMH